MANYYQGKKIWITGASSGIGEALARALAVQGAHLVISGRRAEKLGHLEEELREAGAASVHSLPFDLEVPSARAEALQRVKVMWTAPDILVLNGGLSQRSLCRDTSLAVYRKLMEVDYLANVELSQGFLENWAEKHYGQVVVISSLVGKFGTPYRSGYAAAKHALHGFFDSLRAEAAGQGLKVNIICPGFIQTQVSVNALVGNGEALGTMDQAQANGLEVQIFARKALKAIRDNRAEAYIGKREVFGVYLKRFFPALFRKMITKAKVR